MQLKIPSLRERKQPKSKTKVEPTVDSYSRFDKDYSVFSIPHQPPGIILNNKIGAEKEYGTVKYDQFSWAPKQLSDIVNAHKMMYKGFHIKPRVMSALWERSKGRCEISGIPFGDCYNGFAIDVIRYHKDHNVRFKYSNMRLVPLFVACARHFSKIRKPRVFVHRYVNLDRRLIHRFIFRSIIDKFTKHPLTNTVPLSLEVGEMQHNPYSSTSYLSLRLTIRLCMSAKSFNPNKVKDDNTSLLTMSFNNDTEFYITNNQHSYFNTNDDGSRTISLFDTSVNIADLVFDLYQSIVYKAFSGLSDRMWSDHSPYM